jgi:1,4-alpha-glucan branching enzyme
VIANFTPVPRDGYRLGVPGAGFWAEVLNSDAQIYGGSGIGNRGGMRAERVAASGHEHSLVVTAPPLGIVVFAAQP